MQRVITYIDGFNLYFGLKEKFDRKYLWLDLEKLSKAFLKPDQELIAVKYFTSHIHGNPTKIKRQDTYLEALGILALCKIFYGRFLVNDHICPACGNVEHIPSEKMTDVNIATQLLVDAFTDMYDVAILVSGDTDLSGPITELRHLFPKKKYVVAFPPERVSFELKKVASAFFMIGRSKFASSQFPESIQKSNGYRLKRPSTWK